MYFVFFAVVFACYAFHTSVHVLEHYNRLSESKAIFNAIGITMFVAWFSYFYISFSDPVPMNLSGFNYIGLVLLVIGFYLFLVSHAKVHKRMHGGKGRLVTDGIYRHLRHPMYLGEILLLLGAPVLGQAQLTLFLSPIFIVQILIWRHFEEKELTEEFPEYEKYKKSTWF